MSALACTRLSGPWRPIRGIGKTGGVKLNEVPQPETSTARVALEIATAYCSPALVNHCLRSYVWGASYGIRHGIDFDVELLYVSAMLHDIGLVKEFDSHTVPFEEAGGHVAWVSARAPGGQLNGACGRPKSLFDTCGTRWTSTWIPRDTCSELPPVSTSLDVARTGGQPTSAQRSSIGFPG